MKPELKLVADTGSQLEADQFEPLPSQSEMPFAMVDGEPVTQMPRDLYIPPDALQVFLEAFEGPLDLLLYLIRRQNLNVLDIPIAEITRQYMHYIDVMQDLQLELAGEYLLMAAMLAEIKSRMLLPRPPAEGQEEDDPRAELVRRLQEYERFKKAAEDIDKLPRMERDTVVASAELIERKVVRILPQVTLQEMLLAFKDVLSRADMFAHHHVNRERLSVRQRMSDILSNLREVAFVDFTRLFRAEEGRMGVSVTFSAILELMKEGLIEIVQAEPYAPIHVRPAGNRHLAVVSDEAALEIDVDADAENRAALAQPAQPDEDVIDDDPLDEESLAEDIPVDAPADPVTASEASTSESIAEEVMTEQAISEQAITDQAIMDDRLGTEAAIADADSTDAEIVDAAVPGQSAEQSAEQQAEQADTQSDESPIIEATFVAIAGVEVDDSAAPSIGDSVTSQSAADDNPRGESPHQLGPDESDRDEPRAMERDPAAAEPDEER
jgi:segregation and condensation protein A